MFRVAELVILTMGTIVVIVNILAMISLLRNFRRLRQRMFVFIISLTAVEIVVGSAYVLDVVVGLGDFQGDTATPYVSVGKFVLEGLKNSGIILSAISTAIVTYALHKRTTSMGRHRADSASTSNGDGGVLHLPAFDTMLRVLSLGQNGQDSSKKKSSFYHSTVVNNSYSEAARLSKSDNESPTKKKLPQPDKPSELQEIGSTCSFTNNNITGSRKTNKSETRSSKRSMHVITSLLVPRASWTHVANRRHSNPPSSQPYIGRHGNSVLSVRVTASLLIAAWSTFFLIWLTPILHQFINPAKNVTSNSSWIIGWCEFDYKAQIYLLQTERKNNSRWLTGAGDIDEHEYTPELYNSSSTEGILNSNASICFSCYSYFFYPLSELQVIISAALLTVVWILMLFSATRLLWLRKNSSNVFVRCSALWRFIFLTALFYLCTLAPYIAVSVADFVRCIGISSPVGVTKILAKSELEDFRTLWKFEPMERFYLDLKSCCLLAHCAVLPTLYLVRLLGFRRLLSGV